MADAEIILNLWYIHDDAGLIYSLRVRAYVGTGTDDEKLAMLQHFANLDYLIARPFPIPERFHTVVHENGKQQRMPVASRALLNGLGSPLTLWEDAIKQIEADLPAQTGFGIRQDPLFCSTALLADDSGRLYSGRKLLRLSRKDAAIEVVESTWAPIIAFLAQQGWSPSESAESFLSGNDQMTEEDALALAATGKEIFVQALKDPLAMQVRFELEKFAEIVDFAAGGGFTIIR